MYSYSFCINASTLSWILASLLPPSFLDTYSLSPSSLGCKALCNLRSSWLRCGTRPNEWGAQWDSNLGYKALCMTISFRVLLSICWSSSLVHFRNGPEYLTKGQPRCLSLWWDYGYIVSFRIVYSFSWDTLLNFFHHLPFFDGPLPIFPSIWEFSFLRACRSLGLAVLFLPLCVVSRLSLLAWNVVLGRIPSLCPDCISSLPELGFRFFFIFSKQFDIVRVY